MGTIPDDQNILVELTSTEVLALQQAVHAQMQRFKLQKEEHGTLDVEMMNALTSASTKINDKTVTSD